MLLSYRDPQFWKTFHAGHWQARVPTVIRRPFKVFPFSEELLFRSMNGFAEGLRGGDQRKTCLVSVGDSERAPRRPLRALFRQKSESLGQLERACALVFQKKNFGLMVTQMQAVDPGIWNALTAFLQDARQWIDFPVPRAFLDLFYGNYSSSFTGVHKDTQEIMAFVVRGNKRILVWPFDYFLSRVEGLSPGDKYFNKRLQIDHRKYRKDALVLDARPGDVMYWPSEYWHVSEVQHGRFSAMLSLGLVRQDEVYSKPAPDRSRFSEKLLSRNSDPSHLVERSALLSQDVTGAITRADAARQLRWITGFGFELGGPLVEAPLGKQGKAPANVTVVKNRSSVILWKTDLSHRRILVASNGHSITLPHSSKLVKLLERISRGESVTLSNVPQRARDGRYSVFETNWNKQCALKTRKLTSRRDRGAWLVDWLLRVYAVERMEPAITNDL